MTTRQEIGQRVLLRRREMGMTQKELAERCGFPYQVISGLERGRQSIYAERLGVLAEALKVSADMLLGLRDAVDDADTTPPQRQRTRKSAPVA
jgi:transcriptional regulator with XRE-family HTH domain